MGDPQEPGDAAALPPPPRPLQAKLLEAFLKRFPPRSYDRGDAILLNASTRPAERQEEPALGYVLDGLVRVTWLRGYGAPGNRASAAVAGDGRWIGADAFRAGENLFHYEALVPTSACLVPLAWVREKAPPSLLFDALHSVSLDWCRRVSGPGIAQETDYRRTLLLLYDLRRLHRRPEIVLRQKQVAEMVGVPRPVMLPVLKRLERAGLISVGFGEISVGSAEGLKEALRQRRVASDDPDPRRTGNSAAG
jgi:CRP-like cAMP-binding protein